ncbi:hypothetical protein [Candidatus Bodocaedibacter vickermanii]|uniref:Uncharacterized protein n=1 Tax=Candidatus Bodocaedibacter vickermanii TaxID=2741701 RepID=A0A7L9RS31_9PROT|nr:hypothetical protein CPBP_00169 [Candidatus Paracaedibacteraceae bacterium 'Lake Konstanz']
MSWSLLNEYGMDVPGVVSFRLEQSKEKPATLTWELPTTNAIAASTVSLWREDECIFKGRVYERPTHIQDGLSTWTAIALDDTFQTQRSTIISELNKDFKLSANIKECEGANAGHLHIDRVTHSVSWVSVDKPLTVWDTQGLHERDSLYITPIDQALKGLSGSFKLQNNRMESGMMDVGSHITSRLFHDIETYSGAALEDQWTKIAHKATHAGYDVQHAELLPTTYHRASVPKSLTFLDKNDQLVSIPYQAYSVKLLLSWAMPIITHTTVTVATEASGESIGLTVKDMESANEPELIQELIQWMNAYALNRSFTTQVKCRILVTEDTSVTQLSTQNWCRVLDSRIQSLPIEGPIVSFVLSNEGGITWADVTFMWAPDKAFSVRSSATLKETTGDHVLPPQTPDYIVAWVKVMRDADDQYQYYQRNKTLPFETFAAGFPMTQLEIGLHPVLSESVEYLEKKYTVQRDAVLMR